MKNCVRVASRLQALLASLALIVPMAVQGAGKCEHLVATGGADNPPYLWRDPDAPERLIGANADLLSQAAESLGIKVEMLYTGDAKAALAEARSGRVDILADAVLLAEHLNRFDYVHPAIGELQTLVWVPRERSFDYFSREDLEGLRGTVVKSEPLGDAFERFAQEQLSLRRVEGLTRALQALVTGDADYLLHERFATLARAEPLGLMADVESLQLPVLSRTMHLAIAHDSACNGPWLRGQLALKMTEYRARGLPRQLIEQNLARWTAQQLQPAEPTTD